VLGQVLGLLWGVWRALEEFLLMRVEGDADRCADRKDGHVSKLRRAVHASLINAL